MKLDLTQINTPFPAVVSALNEGHRVLEERTAEMTKSRGPPAEGDRAALGSKPRAMRGALRPV